MTWPTDCAHTSAPEPVIPLLEEDPVGWLCPETGCWASLTATAAGRRLAMSTRAAVDLTSLSREVLTDLLKIEQQEITRLAEGFKPDPTAPGTFVISQAEHAAYRAAVDHARAISKALELAIRVALKRDRELVS